MIQFLRRMKTKRLDYFVSTIVLIVSLILVIESYRGYKFYQRTKMPNWSLTKGVVVSYATGTRNGNYSVKWYDLSGKEHYSNSGVNNGLPKIGDTMEVRFLENEPTLAVVNDSNNILNQAKFQFIGSIIFSCLGIFLIYRKKVIFKNMLN
jgi:hypothetical protein